MSKILIVEDNAESRYLLEQLLTSKGHHIVAAENGEDALRLARQDPPEVIISDIMMPVMNGFRLCREVKKDAGLRNIPFIFYTATFVDKADEKLAMSLGASRFIVKPTEGEEFLQILDEVLDEHRQGVLPVPERPLEGEDTLLEMYDNSIARKLAETVEELQDERRALIKSEQRLKEAQEIAQIGHWEFDLKSNSLECSDEIYRILGLKPQEFDASYEAFMAFVHPDDRASVTKARKESLEKKTSYDIECRALLKDGTIKYVNERFQTLYDDEGMPTCSMGTVQDITERKQAEEKLHHLNLVLRAIREVNQLIVKERDRDALIHKTCEILIKTRGYYNVWIALMDEEGTYITSAEAGLGKDFAPMKKLLKEGQWPACAKKALSKKELVITEEPKTECMDCPLSAKYAGRGAYTICLAHNGRNYGILSVSVPELSIGGKQEHGLIREAAGDIGFALHSIEVEKERKKAEEALREAESLYRLHFENVSDVVFSIDHELKIINISPSVERVLGYKPGKLIGRPFQELNVVAPEYLEQAASDIVRVLGGERISSVEYQFIARDGTKKWIELSGAPLIKDSQVVAVVSVARDITERKQGEEKLRVSENRFRELFDNMSSAVAVYEAVDGGRDFVFKDFNKAGERIENIRRDEAIGRHVTEVFPGVSDFGLLNVFRRVWKTGTPEHFPVKLYLDNRTRGWRENFAYKLPSGEVVSIYDDVTERKEAEEALREAYDIINKSSSVAFTWKNQEGWPVEFVSENVERLFGYTAEEFISGVVNYIGCIHPEDLERVAQEVAEFSSSAETTEFTHIPYRIIAKDGSEKIINDWTYIVRDNDGRITHYKGIVEDITERKRAEEELRHERDFVSRVMETSPVCITIVDREGKITFANPGAEEVLGLSSNEVTGRTFNAPEWRITDFDGSPYPDEQLPFRQVMDTGLPVYDVRHAIEWPDGRKVLLSVNGAPLFDNVDQVEGVVFTIENVTEQIKTSKALVESEYHYRTLFEQSKDPIFLTTREGKFIDINQAFLDLFGYTKAEIARLNAEEIYVDPNDRRRFKQKVEKAGFTRDFEVKLRKKDGTEIDGVLNSAVQKDEDGSILGYQGFIWDITERKQAERELEEERNVLRTVINNVPDYIYVKDTEGRYVISNNAHVRFLGATKPEEVIGKTAFELFSKDLAEKYHADDQEVFGSGKPIINREELSMDETGKKVLNLTSKVPLCDSSGKIRGLVGIARDLTERKETEEKIKEYSKNLESMVEERTKALNRALYDTEQARDRIDGILKSVGDGLIVTDLYNRVILMNRAAEDLLGVRLSEVIDRPIDFAIEDKTLRDKIKTTLDKKETGYQFDFELPGYNSAHPRIIRARTSIIEDKSGTQTGIITTIHDVTYEREVDRMKTEFISTAAHELRTPLTSILGFSEVLLNQDTLPAEEKKEFLGYINTQSKALSKIIDDLLDISRIESGQGFSMSKEPCDPFRITRKVISYYEKLSPTHRFEVMFPKRPIRIMADRDKLEQVVKNLIDNAVKYSPDGGAIRIRGKRVGDQYQISVEDQGIGMTPEQVERMFDKFYRAKDASFISKGTGLGMSIVKHIVEFHGGKVWVESEHGKGTTVSFTVPVGEENGK
jgi:PAS domain S-box-containing protein